jgi:hypothetical protein
MEFVPIVVLLATVKKIVDLMRYARGGDYNGVITQLVVWAAGVAVVALAANTVWADGIVFGDTRLAGLNLASQVLAGIALGSAASLTQDAFKAVDNSQSEAKPPLVGPQ